jgi:hypothetical protein
VNDGLIGNTGTPIRKEHIVRKSIPLTAAFAVAVSLAAPQMAAAAPQNGSLVTFTCDDGQTVTVVNPSGHAQWTPGIVLGAGGVLKPVAFKEVQTVYNPDGTVATSATVTGQQANGTVEQNNPRPMVNCFNESTYTSDEVPTLSPGQTLIVDLTITGFFTGAA